MNFIREKRNKVYIIYYKSMTPKNLMEYLLELTMTTIVFIFLITYLKRQMMNKDKGK